jgi:hypothetical protein
MIASLSRRIAQSVPDVHRLKSHQTKSQQESPAIADGASTRNDACAYLGVAHIYMLISMPTGTSTIFGAFQAIWALPFIETGRKNSALSH